ncbi:hypothetical protein HN51_044885 [Arachis hypogaea]|nr:villin-3 [Arachis hypogaea]
MEEFRAASQKLGDGVGVKSLMQSTGLGMIAGQSHDRLNGLNQGGPRQRVEALAALNSAFKSTSGTKSSSPKTTGKSQGSQRAAAVAALSQVLTAEKKKQSPDFSPVATRSPVVETSTSGEKYSSYCPS